MVDGIEEDVGRVQGTADRLVEGLGVAQILDEFGQISRAYQQVGKCTSTVFAVTCIVSQSGIRIA